MHGYNYYMIANREQRNYSYGERVWVGAYRNSQNIPHWHYDCEIVYLESGGLNVFCNGATLTLEEGQAVFINSGQVHHLHALTPQTTVKHIIFSYEIIESFANRLSLASPLLSCGYSIPGIYDGLKNILKEKKQFYRAKAEHIVTGLMLDVFSRESTVYKDLREIKAERLKPLLKKIDENFEFYTLENAAEFMHMNTSYFSRLFHTLTGVTFSQYLNSVRLNRAVQLLRESKNLSMTEISSRCGFDTIRNFNRIFKNLTGYTPGTLPEDFTLNHYTGYTPPKNPTLPESELIESSDD